MEISWHRGDPEWKCLCTGETLNGNIFAPGRPWMGISSHHGDPEWNYPSTGETLMAISLHPGDPERK